MANTIGLQMIPVARIQENTNALRTEVEKDSLQYQELAASVKREGILIPILVRQETDADGNVFYPLVDGLQRYTAACEAGLAEIPARITDMAESKVLAAQIMANATRVDTPPAQYAIALKKILQLEQTLTSEDLGNRVGKSKSWIEHQLKLTKLTPEIQKLVDDGQLTVSNAVSLSSLPADKQSEYLQPALTESPATFGPRITELVKEIRAAARQGRVVDKSFKPTIIPRKTTQIKEIISEIETGNCLTLRSLLDNNNVTDPYEAAVLTAKFFASLDPQSVAMQKAKYDQEQAQLAADKTKREQERAEKKAQAARDAAKNVVNA
jgi:ParB family chromosome partitioning protein